jgi:hypothetical protein
MLSIKVDINNIEEIVNCFNILIYNYVEKGNDLNNAIILVPSKVYKIMTKRCNKEEIEEGVGIRNEHFGWVRLIKDINLKDECIIIDRKFFNI